MAVRFIIGRSGSGKTVWCLDRIVESIKADPLGPAIFWLVPKQATFQAQRQLACDPRLGGFFRVRVVSFEELSTQILEDCGVMAVPEVTDLGRQMILGHLLRKLVDKLKFFKAVAHQPGLAAELDGTFAELERCGQEASALPQIMAQQQGDGVTQPLLEKLHDLELIYHEYRQFLGQDRLDPQRWLDEAMSRMRHCPMLKGAAVYVDAFYDFTQFERQVLAGLAAICPVVFITLTMDPASKCLQDPHRLPDELSLFYRCEDTYRRLWFAFSEKAVTVEKPLLLKAIQRFDNPAIATLEQWTSPTLLSQPLLSTPSPGTPGEGRGEGFSSTGILPVSGVARHGQDARATANPHPNPPLEYKGRGNEVARIELVEAPDRRAEVDAAARRIGDLCAAGLRYRDIALLMRSSEDYHELIDASFSEHGIPYFIDTRRTAAHHPLVQFIRAALLVVRNNWPHDAVMALIKSGLVGLDPQEADELENYVLLHGIRHGTWVTPEPWTGKRATSREGEDSPTAAVVDPLHVDQLRRRLTDRVRPLAEKLNSTPELSVREISTAIMKFLEDCQVRPALTAWMRQAELLQRWEERDEHLQVWAELTKLLQQLVDVLGEEKVTPADYQAILDTGLERFDLALTPPTVDQVLVGQADRIRTPALKAVIVLGLCEGQFPKMAREDSVFSDSDRRVLRQREIDIDPDTQRQSLDEIFLGYLAFTRASSHLCLMRSTADAAGKALNPSPLWLRITETFPSLKPQRIEPEEKRSLGNIATPRQLVTSLMRWVRSRPAAIDGQSDALKTDPWASLYQWLADYERCDDAVGVMRYRAWKSLSYSNSAALSPEIAGRLFMSPLKARVAQLESMRNCPFQHFARYGLGLRQREQRDVTSRDLSQVYHDVLDRLLRQLMIGSGDWSDLSDEKAAQMVHSLTEQVGRNLRGELMLSTARNQYLLARIEETLKAVVAAQRGAANRGQFRPGWTNLRFEENADLPALRVITPRGSEAILNGRIDRVDVLKDGDAFAVLDYRLGGGALNIHRVYHGLSLQLLTYLLVLQASGEKLARRKLNPAAAFYVQLLRWVEDKDPEKAYEPADERFHLQIKPRGIFDARYARQLDSKLGGGWSDVVQAYGNKDGGFGYRGSSDVVDSAEMDALLKHVRRRLGELTDRILAGEIEVSPYRIGRVSPCSRCEFADLCRFDPAINRYSDLRPMKREEIFKQIAEERD